MRKSLLLFAPLLIFSRSSEAQVIYNCSGRWTNVPCEDGQKIMPEIQPRERTPDEIDREKKLSLYRGLSIKQGNAKNNYGIDIDISSAELLCNNNAATVQSCEDKVVQLLDRIDEGVSHAEKTRAEEKEREKQNQLAQGDNNTVVVIQEERVPFFRRRRFFDRHHDNQAGDNQGGTIHGRFQGNGHDIDIGIGGSAGETHFGGTTAVIPAPTAPPAPLPGPDLSNPAARPAPQPPRAAPRYRMRP